MTDSTTLTCGICGNEFKSENGLREHTRFKHPDRETEKVAEQPLVNVVAPRTKPNGMRSTGGLNRPGKMVKMIQARCRECNPHGQGPRGWWETCTHDPYHHLEPQVVADSFIEQEDGTFVQNPNPTKTYVRVPNWRPVPDDPAITSARSVRIQTERGSKFPTELGYAPICDYRNCWESNPQIHANKVITIEGASVRVGDYHTRDEAAMMTLRFNQKPVYIGLDQDIENRRAQLDAVQIL